MSAGVAAELFYEVPPGAYDILRVALAEARLPVYDIDEPGRVFYGMSDDRSLIGYVGAEGGGPDRLLRSLVVLPSRRGEGHGRRLVRHVESCVKGNVERLHLFTTSAAPWFRGLGYVDADRADAPAAIAATAQFSSLCPASATYLVKTL